MHPSPSLDFPQAELSPGADAQGTREVAMWGGDMGMSKRGRTVTP